MAKKIRQLTMNMINKRVLRSYVINIFSKSSWSTGEVPQRISSHLETIVSRALQPRDGRIPCLVDRNLEIFLTSHVEFFVHFCTMCR